MTRRRQPTRRLDGPWPFMYSYVPGRGLVLNTPKINRPRKRVTKERR